MYPNKISPSSPLPVRPPAAGGNSAKIAALIVVVVLLFVLGVGVFVFMRSTMRGGLSSASPADTDQVPVQVSLTSEYKNPFDQDSQYVNPFEEFKSPFHSLQQ